MKDYDTRSPWSARLVTLQRWLMHCYEDLAYHVFASLSPERDSNLVAVAMTEHEPRVVLHSLSEDCLAEDCPWGQSEGVSARDIQASSDCLLIETPDQARDVVRAIRHAFGDEVLQ